MGVFTAVVLLGFCRGSRLKNSWWRQVHSLDGHSVMVRSVAFSPDGNRVASGAKDRVLKIWDTETGAEVSSFVGVR